MRRLWTRGGLPESFLADSDERSLAWRRDYFRTVLGRDIAEFGPRVPVETLRRFWTMLAHLQGSVWRAARPAAELGLDVRTVNRYLDLLADLLLARLLPPFTGNIGKRLIRSPKVYIRDSGLTHALLEIRDFPELLGHPVCGPSWEGFVIENLLGAAPVGTLASFYRTSHGAELDLVLELPGQRRPWAVEIKRGAPRASRGFHTACADIEAGRALSSARPKSGIRWGTGPRRSAFGRWPRCFRNSDPAQRGDHGSCPGTMAAPGRRATRRSKLNRGSAPARSAASRIIQSAKSGPPLL